MLLDSCIYLVKLRYLIVILNILGNSKILSSKKAKKATILAESFSGRFFSYSRTLGMQGMKLEIYTSP